MPLTLMCAESVDLEPGALLHLHVSRGPAWELQNRDDDAREPYEQLLQLGMKVRKSASGWQG